MKNSIFSYLLLSIIVTLFGSLLISSCASMKDGPQGGPRDTIPPLVVASIPENLQRNFTEKEIEFTFNEFVVADKLSDILVISPPLGKKPTIRTSGKTVKVRIDEDLIPNRTYSVDFRDGIKDYNEGNKLNGLRLIFSTGNKLDTLRIGGYIIDALTHKPVPDVLATLYTLDNDSIFKNLNPDFIARTNDEGYFLFDNLPAGEYKLYGLKDDDNDLHYSQRSELIAFSDTMITPSASFAEQPDTVINNTDTIIIKGHTEYKPGDVKLLLFSDYYYSQHLISDKRDLFDRCMFIFSEPITDSVKVDLIGKETTGNWNEIEYSNDSVSVWITDSILARTDTLRFALEYSETIDSLNTTKRQIDTLKMIFSAPQLPKQKKKEEPPKVEYFRFTTNLSSSKFDLDKKIIIVTPSPTFPLTNEMFSLSEVINDSTVTPLNFNLLSLKNSNRKYQLDFEMLGDKKYRLSVDTAIVKTYTGIPNQGFKSTFTTQEDDYYGSIIITLNGTDNKGILSVIKPGKTESIIREVPVDKAGQPVTINFLKPDKYIVKFFEDLNENGIWDTGRLSDKKQPEPVYYFPKEINVKSNWEMKETWEIKPGDIEINKIEDNSKDENKPAKK